MIPSFLQIKQNDCFLNCGYCTFKGQYKGKGIENEMEKYVARLLQRVREHLWDQGIQDAQI